MLLFATCTLLQIIACTATKPRSVNVELETVFKFDKNNADIKLLDNVQNFLDKIKSAVAKKPDRRTFDKPIKFTEFVKKTINILKNYSDNDLENVFIVIDDEARKYHYKGCKFHELLQNADFRRFVAEKLSHVKEKPAKVIRKMLDRTLEIIDKAKYDTNLHEILDYINSLYGKDDAEKLTKLIDKLKQYNSYKRYNIDLISLVRNGLRSVIFDHYSNLNTNTRTDFKLKLETFSKDITHRSNDRTLNIEYKNQFSISDPKLDKNMKVSTKKEAKKAIVNKNIGTNSKTTKHKKTISKKSEVEDKESKELDKSKEIVRPQTSESTDDSLSKSNELYIKDSIEVHKNRQKKQTTAVFISVEHQNQNFKWPKIVQNTTRRPKYTFITLYPEEITINTKKRFKIAKSTLIPGTPKKMSNEKMKPTEKPTKKYKIQTIWPETQRNTVKYRASPEDIIITHNLEINVGHDEITRPSFTTTDKSKPKLFIRGSENTGESSKEASESYGKESDNDNNENPTLKLHFTSQKKNNNRRRSSFFRSTEEQSTEVSEGMSVETMDTKKNADLNKRRLIQIELADDIESTQTTAKTVAYNGRPTYPELHYWEGTEKDDKHPRSEEIERPTEATLHKSTYSTIRPTVSPYSNEHTYTKARKDFDSKHLHKDVEADNFYTNKGDFKTIKSNFKTIKSKYELKSITKPTISSETKRVKLSTNTTEPVKTTEKSTTYVPQDPEEVPQISDKDLSALAKFVAENQPNDAIPFSRYGVMANNNASIVDNEFNQLLSEWKDRLDKANEKEEKSKEENKTTSTTRNKMFMDSGAQMSQFKENIRAKMNKLKSEAKPNNIVDKLQEKAQLLLENIPNFKNTTKETIGDEVKPSKVGKLADTVKIGNMQDLENIGKVIDIGNPDKISDTATLEKMAIEANRGKHADIANRGKLANFVNRGRMADIANRVKMSLEKQEKLSGAAILDKIAHNIANREKDRGTITDTARIRKLANIAKLSSQVNIENFGSGERRANTASTTDTFKNINDTTKAVTAKTTQINETSQALRFDNINSANQENKLKPSVDANTIEKPVNEKMANTNTVTVQKMPVSLTTEAFTTAAYLDGDGIVKDSQTDENKELDNELHEILTKYGVTLPSANINPNELGKSENNNDIMSPDKNKLVKDRMQEDFAKMFKMPKRRAFKVETEFPDPFQDLKDVP